MAPHTQASVLFVTAERRKRVKTMNWVYPADYLQLVMAASAPMLKAEVLDVDPRIGTVDGRPHKALRLSLA